MQEPTANAEQQRLIAFWQGALWKMGALFERAPVGTVRKDGGLGFFST